MAFRSKLRRRWRSWLVIAILISIVGGLVVAATAAGRRTEAAFPQFVAAHGFDTVAYATRPVPKVAKLPGVTSAVELVGPDAGQPMCDCTQPIDPTDFGVIVAPTKGRSPIKLVSGRVPDPSAPDQVLASFTLQQVYGVHLGSVIRVPFYALSQASAYNNATGAPPKPDGLTIAFRRGVRSSPSSSFLRGLLLRLTSSPPRRLRGRYCHGRPPTIRTWSACGGVRLVSRDSTLPLVRQGEGGQNEDEAAAAIETSIHPQAIGWWILAALAALVGLAVVGQALARQSIVESEDYPTMAALGANRRQLAALGMAQNLVVGLVGAAGAVAVATVLSPIAPLGEARVAESSTGIAFDTPVLLLGALATVAVVLVLGTWPSLRAAHALRSDDRPVTVALLGRGDSLGGDGCTSERGDRRT
jgi:hypothetical protein